MSARSATAGRPGRLPERLGIVVGLETEARIARRLAVPELVAVGGATADGARRAAAVLRERGVDALMSFGLAAGLDPTLRPGNLLVPKRVRVGETGYETDHVLEALLPGAETGELLHSEVLVTERPAKAGLFAATGCVALDMESGAVAVAAADAGLPFLVLRAVCDPAWCRLPQAATLPLAANGRVAVGNVVLAVMRRPSQIPELIRLGRYVDTAFRALRREVEMLLGHQTG